MKIEINIDETRVEEQVIQEIADRLIQNYSETRLAQTVRKAMDAEVLTRLEQVIADHVSEMLSRPIQTYDTFGSPVGTPISLSDVLRNGADTYLTQLVKHDGTIGNNYDTRKTRLHWVVEKVAMEGLSKEINEHAKGIRVELQKKAQAAAAQLIANMKV